MAEISISPLKGNGGTANSA
ncbi:hypothetical protein A2U01_0064619, partial [Trifolium medium]|nr:hypothetical protein [Trifolium medium]